jgi:hypothetical protein
MKRRTTSFFLQGIRNADPLPSGATEAEIEGEVGIYISARLTQFNKSMMHHFINR